NLPHVDRCLRRRGMAAHFGPCCHTSLRVSGEKRRGPRLTSRRPSTARRAASPRVAATCAQRRGLSSTELTAPLHLIWTVACDGAGHHRPWHAIGDAAHTPLRT